MYGHLDLYCCFVNTERAKRKSEDALRAAEDPVEEEVEAGVDVGEPEEVEVLEEEEEEV